MKLPAFLFLFLSSATISSAWAGTEAPGAQGRSTYSSPSTENVMDFQSDRAAGAYGGPPIQIVVPNVGIFTGWLHGDVLEAKFSGAVAKAVYELAPEPDYLQLVKPTAPVDSNP